MKRRIILSIFFFFHIIIILMACLSCVCVTSRPLSPHHHNHHFSHQQAQIPQLSQQGVSNNSTKGEEEYRYRGELGRLGSRPPNCGHKCGVCMPCEAVQIPTTTDRLSTLQIANYEPEGWKCKCGLSFFNP